MEATTNTENKSNLYPKGGEVTFLMPSTNAIAKLKEAKKGRELTMKYRTKEEWFAMVDQPERCFFLGLKEAPDDKGNTFYIAKLSNGDKTFVCAQTILIQALSQVPFGQGVEITCTGSVKTNGNNIPTFEVIDLEVNILNGTE